MKLKENKKSIKDILLLIIILAAALSVCIFYSIQKSGMFLDEIYTYGLSNGYYTPFVTDIGDGIVNREVTRDELTEYMTVGDEGGFNFSSVYYNQTQDVHPPMYYWLLNISSSFAPNSCSKWIGLIPNMIIFMFTLVMLYLLTDKLYHKKRISLLAAALYGLSTLAISTVIMIRMYVLLTLFTVILAYQIACLMEESKLRLYALVMLTIFLGLMTQYYFVFYAFFLCAAYDVYLLIKKEYRSFILFSVFALAGVLLLVAAYPACLKHLFADKLVSGGSMLDCIKNTADYKRRFTTYIFSINYYARVAVKVGLLACLAVLIKAKTTVKGIKNREIDISSLVIIIPAFFAFAFVAISSPVIPLRYVYNIIPIFIVTVCFAVYVASCAYADKGVFHYIAMLFVPVVAVIALVVALNVTPEFIYKEHVAYNEAVTEYASSPCVYFDDNYASSLTQDMLQLMTFDDVFVADEMDSPELFSYIDGHDDNNSLVVYVDVDGEWSSGFDPEEVLNSLLDKTDYSKYEQLYAYGSSETYVLKK